MSSTNGGRVNALIVLLAFACSILGCGAALRGEPSFPRALPHQTLVAYLRTGGIAGLDELLVVRFDRRVTVIVGYHHSTSTYRLSATELSRLREQLAAAHLRRLASRPTGICCDMIDTWIYGDRHTVANPPLTSNRAAFVLLEHLQAIVARRPPRPPQLVNGG